MSDIRKAKIDITGLIAHGWTDKNEVFDTLLLASDAMAILEDQITKLEKVAQRSILLSKVWEEYFIDGERTCGVADIYLFHDLDEALAELNPQQEE